MDYLEWEELMTECGLYHRFFTIREARLAFIWSRMRCLDESGSTKAFSRSRSLTFLEFLEALGRVADFVSPPPLHEILESGCSSTTEYYKRGSELIYYLPDRTSAQIMAPKTRALDQKIEQVICNMNGSDRLVIGRARLDYPFRDSIIGQSTYSAPRIFLHCV